MVLKSAQRMPYPQSEKIQMTSEMCYSLTRKIKQKRQPPDFVTDVASNYFHFSNVGIGYAQFQQVRIWLTVMSGDEKYGDG